MRKKFTFGKVRTVRRENSGFVLLLTMLMISVILSVSLSIFSVTLKGVQLATFMNQSERAFITADRALECALYWDRATQVQTGITGYFSPFRNTNDVAWVLPPSSTSIICGGTTGTGQLTSLGSWTSTGVSATEGRTTYTLVYDDGSSADVVVEKTGIVTKITSNGYNTSDANNWRRTQRTIVATYNL